MSRRSRAATETSETHPRPWATLPGQLRLLAAYLGRVLPAVNRTLDGWERRAAAIPAPELRRQALASIRTKRFHCEGGAVFAAAAPPRPRAGLIRLIVALQTISDYLDNLCDRSASLDPADYRQLHRAMLDAVRPPAAHAWLPRPAPGEGRNQAGTAVRDTGSGGPPGAPIPDPLAVPGTRGRRGDGQPAARARGEARTEAWARAGTGAGTGPGAPPPPGPGDTTDYYRLHPHGEDGGYLAALVTACHRVLDSLPGYPAVAPRVVELVGLYNDLQVNKHGPPGTRLPRLQAWYRRRAGPFRGRLAWWEFAAACGSTLGVFALFREAALHARPDPARITALVDAYFPWIGGLHILLDYFIDREEDRAGGDLNLVSYYPDREEMARRLLLFVREARRRAARLPDRALHELVVSGLLGLYLSDPKVAAQGLEDIASRLLAAGGPGARICHAASLALRRWRARAR